VQFVDSHCHLDDQQFAADRAAVVDRALAAGLKYLLAIGTGDGPPDLATAVRLAESNDNILATVGVHPNDAPKLEDTSLDHLADLLQHPKVVAIGEIGLDYHWGVPKELQEPLFRRQLEIAASRQLPVVIHTRDAWQDTLAILRDQWAPTRLPCIMHCFTGGVRAADECLQLGFYLAFGGVTTFPKSGAIREAAAITPPDRLLLETDAPYLAPLPHRGKRNEPSFVIHTAKAIASVRGTTLEQLASETTANFEKAFRLRHPLN
jgi:TatD DNase family protein